MSNLYKYKWNIKQHNGNSRNESLLHTFKNPATCKGRPRTRAQMEQCNIYLKISQN